MNATRVSIIVNNYNYAAYLPQAIDSALAQDYPHCEVIVVDDGSQDHSRQVIAGYADRVRPVLKENGGQGSAFNAGFAAASGEIVFFLDADDLLEVSAARRAAETFSARPDLARLQFRMQVVDAAGRATGAVKPPPHVAAPSGDIRPLMLRFPFDLPWLPTSGNAFAARVLREVLPVPAEYGRINADYYLVHAAALFGPVHFLDEVLACYRVHGGNNFESSGGELNMERLRLTIQYDELTYTFLRALAEQADGLDGQGAGGRGSDPRPQENRSLSTAASRLVSLRLDPQAHPFPEDRTWPLLRLGLRSAVGRTDTSAPARVIFAAWVAAMAVAPRRVAAWLAGLFFFPERRPGFSQLLGRLHRGGARNEAGRQAQNGKGG
jgi:hypothetical protein